MENKERKNVQRNNNSGTTGVISTLIFMAVAITVMIILSKYLG